MQIYTFSSFLPNIPAFFARQKEGDEASVPTNASAAALLRVAAAVAIDIYGAVNNGGYSPSFTHHIFTSHRPKLP